MLSIWRERLEEIELLQTQSLAEQPVCALDWCLDKKGKINQKLKNTNVLNSILFQDWLQPLPLTKNYGL